MICQRNTMPKEPIHPKQILKPKPKYVATTYTRALQNPVPPANSGERHVYAQISVWLETTGRGFINLDGDSRGILVTRGVLSGCTKKDNPENKWVRYYQSHVHRREDPRNPKKPASYLLAATLIKDPNEISRIEKALEVVYQEEKAREAEKTKKSNWRES